MDAQVAAPELVAFSLDFGEHGNVQGKLPRDVVAKVLAQVTAPPPGSFVLHEPGKAKDVTF